MELFENANTLSSITKLVYKAVQKRVSEDRIVFLRLPEGNQLARSVCSIVLGVKHVERCPTAVTAFIPMNSPQPPTMVTWRALEFSSLVSLVINQKVHILAAVKEFLDKQFPYSENKEDGTGGNETNTEYCTQLVFFDSDCRPLFVTANEGILPAEEFDRVMCARRQPHAEVTLSDVVAQGFSATKETRFLQQRRSSEWPAPFTNECSDWQENSDSDDPWA